MKKISLFRSSMALLVLIAGACGHAYATPVPEIDPATATSGLVVLASVVLMVRGRRR